MTLGYVSKWKTDNCNNLVSDLNRVNAYVHGYEMDSAFAYSPWQTKVKSLASGIGINKYNFDHFGMNGLYDNLHRLNRKAKYANYSNYLPALEFANNNTVILATHLLFH
eukprot:953370_1